LKYKQDGVLDKNRVIDNAQEHSICTYARCFPEQGILKSSLDSILLTRETYDGEGVIGMDGRHAADIKAKSKRRDFSGSFNS
jgi:hypothetical protein